MSRSYNKRGERGFTLVEMLVTLAIVAALASIGLPLAELAVQRQHEQELRAALREIRTAIDAYKLASDQGRIAKEAEESGYPPTLEALVNGVEDARSKEHEKIYFLRRLPRDPFHPNKQTPEARTWGLRSYVSPPDKPRAGKDVYDVYSLATGVGLNGVEYSRW